MAKILKLAQLTPDHAEFLFQCPGCGNSHWFKTVGSPPVWSFNGDMDEPTISPSILVSGDHDGKFVCHSFVAAGMIRFLSDCTHPLAGQTVEIPDW